MAYPVSKTRFSELVEEALALLPDEFAALLEEVRIEILDRPMARHLELVRDEDRGSMLLGLYHGRPLTGRSIMDSGALPDAIYLFQKNLESICDSEDDLREQVRVTLLHEIGHHLGMDEDQLDDLGYG